MQQVRMDTTDLNRKVTTGQSAALGATLTHGGVNFSIFSRHASGVDLLFFD
jgi:glycogen operon protein